MQNVIVYAPSAATRKLYHLTLSKRDLDVCKAKDMAEVLVLVATFEVDSVVLVDEGLEQHELNLIIDLHVEDFRLLFGFYLFNKKPISYSLSLTGEL